MNIGTPTPGIRADSLAKLENLAAAAGVTLPKSYITAAKEHRQALARARIALEPNPGALSAAITAALVEGRDLTEDESVRRAVAHAAVTDRRAEVLRAFIGYEAVILRDHRDAIIKACAKPAQDAYAAISEAVSVAPGLHRNSVPEVVLRSDARVSAAWTAARDAQAQLKAFGPLLRSLPKVRIHSDDEPYLHLEPSRDLDRKAMRSEWDAALAGHQLVWCGDLATFRERVTQADELRRNLDAAERAQALAERQKQTQPVVDAYASRVAAGR